MANTIIITSVVAQGGDSLLATGTVNGVNTTANVSRAVLGSFANATNAQNYVAMKLLEANLAAISQGAITPVTGTVNL